ncbi:hypothetical protein [Coleofasciculus chthonoplastes]|uniref:hypothetical protein n=1 Tax=Coleofasciculus chthonoplastes TaxID=64178 RepID=UPI0018DE0A9F|nr:hypothetical protein [Coleofasciculus chthonoplastes]
MTYLLDLNICIRWLNNTSPSVRTHLAAEKPDTIYWLLVYCRTCRDAPWRVSTMCGELP